MVYLSVWSGQSIQTSTPSTTHPLQTPSDPLPPPFHPEEDLDCVPNKTARRNYRAVARACRQAGRPHSGRASHVCPCSMIAHCEIDNEYPPTELVRWSTERGERRGKQGNAAGDVFFDISQICNRPGRGRVRVGLMEIRERQLLLPSSLAHSDR